MGKKPRKPAVAPICENIELERLMDLAMADLSSEPAFFGALLAAEVYAHKPAHDVGPNLRLVQFPHPETGEDLLPFFSDLSRQQKRLIPGWKS